MSKIPGIKANTIQTIRFCNAISLKGVEVYLLVRCKLGEMSPSRIKRNIIDFYGDGDQIKVIPIFIPILNSSNQRVEEIVYLVAYVFYSFIASIISVILKTLLRKKLYVFIRTPPIMTIYYLFRFIHKSKVIYEMHSLYRRKPGSLLLRLFIASLKKTRLIITISNYLENIVKRWISATKIIALHDAYDPSTFRIAVTDISTQRKELGIPLDKWIIVYAGQLWAWKNPEFLIDALSMIPTGDTVLLFIGGSFEDIKRVSTYADKKGVKNVFFKGFVKPILVAKYLKVTDCLVHYTPSTGAFKSYSPLKVLEYMAAGKPILAPRQPWIKEILHDGVNAILFDENSPRDLAEKILLVKNNKKLAENVGKNAMKDSKKYTYEKRAETFLKTLLTIEMH
jgi:glycosyltransferase involved in cell wall biosynthesis